MSSLPYKTLRENVVDEIRAKILNRELKPGMHIVEQNLSDEFGVSRGPIREALRQLEQEGLIEYLRNVGCSVKSVTIEDVYEIYLLKSTYEVLAVRQCDARFTEQELKEMDGILNRMRNPESGHINELIFCDHALHEIIIEKAGLERVARAWRELNYGSNIAGVYSETYHKNMAEHQYQIHKELVDVCRTGNQEEICHAIYTHYMLPVRKIMQEQGYLVNKYKWSL